MVLRVQFCILAIVEIQNRTELELHDAELEPNGIHEPEELELRGLDSWVRPEIDDTYLCMPHFSDQMFKNSRNSTVSSCQKMTDLAKSKKLLSTQTLAGMEWRVVPATRTSSEHVFCCSQSVDD